MNIALSAVVIFILLLPPIAFYLSYNIGAFSKANPKLGLLEGLMLSAIVSILIHAITLTIIHTEIRFDILALLLGGDLDKFSDKVSNQGFQKMLLNFVWYNASLVVGAIIIARICRWVIWKKGWHANTGILRIYNYWGYLFMGYAVDEDISEGKPLKFDIIYVDALVNTNAGSVIYSGYLIDFVYFGETLDRIYLSETIKREFKIDHQIDTANTRANTSEEVKLIEGHTMVIPYSTIINMNLNFIQLSEEFDEIDKSEIEVPQTSTPASA